MTLSIDVGGTKVLAAILSDDGKVIRSQKIPTSHDYPTFLNELEILISNLCTDRQPDVCSIAMPGRIDRERGVVVAFGNLEWKNIPIIEDIGQFLSCKIYLENDANLAGLAEATALLNIYRKVLYVTVSTGIGGVLIVDGKIDPETADAEIGHTLSEYGDRLMRWEEFASGKAIVAKTGKMASEITDEKDWYFVARNIAIGLINVIATLTPECVVLGGGVGAHLEKFQEKLYEELEIYANDMFPLPQILKAQHPEEAVIYGGFLLAKQRNLDHE